MKNLLNLIKAYLLSVVVFLLLMAINVLTIMYTDFKEEWGGFVTLGAFSISACIFGLLSGRAVGRRGLLVGILSSIVFITLFSLFLLSIFDITILDLCKNVLWLVPFICCTIGGIIGANSNN